MYAHIETDLSFLLGLLGLGLGLVRQLLGLRLLVLLERWVG